MTYTYKLARRLARLRFHQVLPLFLLSACAAGEPTGISNDNNPPIDTGTEGPVAVSPRTVTLEGTENVLFRAFESLIPGSNQVTSIEWTATGGSIDATGSYTAATTGSFKVVGRRKGNPHNQPDTAVVIVVPPQPTLQAVLVTPSTATVGGGTQQQFSAIGRQSDGTQVQIGVTWTATGGTIDAGGLYTAGRTGGTYRVIAKHVTTGLADTAVVTVPAATLASISLSPSSANFSSGQSLQFAVTGRMSDGTTTYSVPVAYSATGGSVSVTGYYTAGSTAGTFRVIATAEGGKADTSSVTIGSSTSTSPATFVGDFETGNLSQYWLVQQCTSDRITVYSATSQPTWPKPFQGTYAARFNVFDTDVYPCTPTENPRAQALSPELIPQGSEVWISFAVLFDNTLPQTQPGFFTIQSVYGTPGDGSGSAHLIMVDNATAFEYEGTGWKTPLVRNVWHKFMFHLKLSKDPAVGFVEIWYNGVPQILPASGTYRVYKQTINTGTTSPLESGLRNYRKAGMWPGAVAIFFDGHRVGPTRESVENTSSTLVASQ